MYAYICTQADVLAKHERLQSDVTYLQTRLDAKQIMVSLLKGNLHDAERLTRGLQVGLVFALDEVHIMASTHATYAAHAKSNGINGKHGSKGTNVISTHSSGGNWLDKNV